MASTREKYQRVSLTKTRIENLSPPVIGQQFVRDAKLPGFAVRITAKGVRSFIVEKRIGGHVRRITLGRYPAMTVEQARKQAHVTLGKIASGGDPVAEKIESRAKGVTLAEVFSEFMDARKNLKPRTRAGYTHSLNCYLSDWLKKPLASITKDKVDKRHRLIGKNNGPAAANLTMRTLSSIYNFAQAKYENRNGHSIFPENPVMRLRQARSWYKVERRRSVIKSHQLPDWYAGVMSLKDEGKDTVADYLLLLLFTGLRREEAASLRWDDVDLAENTLLVRDTKNHEPLTLPLSDYLQNLLHTRYETTPGEYVFPGTGATGHIIGTKRSVARVRERSGVNFTLHDLRRTFITVAESLDISYYAIKHLVNHKMSGDVTAGYIVCNVERLRGPMQSITNFICQSANIKRTGVVIPFPKGEKA